MKNKQAFEFDEFANNYDEELAKGLSLTGEDREYYAKKRIQWLSHQLRKFSITPRNALDFGCGVGSTSPILLEQFNLGQVIGLDVSEKNLTEARRRYGSERIQFYYLDDFSWREQFDLVYCNGVFHHIPPDQRPGAVSYINHLLQPTGIFALWENNPWNPGTRLIMSRVSFDRDAIMLWPAEARRLLRQNNFNVINTSYMFVFPRIMGILRRLEPPISNFPFGGQYLVLGMKRS